MKNLPQSISIFKINEKEQTIRYEEMYQDEVKWEKEDMFKCLLFILSILCATERCMCTKIIRIDIEDTFSTVHGLFTLYYLVEDSKVTISEISVSKGVNRRVGIHFPIPYSCSYSFYKTHITCSFRVLTFEEC